MAEIVCLATLIRQRTFRDSLSDKWSMSSLDAVNSWDGHVITKSHRILNRWKEYCAELYNDPIVTSAGTVGKVLRLSMPTCCYSALKLRKLCGNWRRWKHPVLMEPAELPEAGGYATVDVLHILWKFSTRKKEWPEDWTKAYFRASTQERGLP